MELHSIKQLSILYVITSKDEVKYNQRFNKSLKYKSNYWKQLNNKIMKYLDKYIVVCKWVESYENPIILKKDEKVVVNLAIKRNWSRMGKLGLVHSGQWNDRLGTYTNFETYVRPYRMNGK